MIVSRFLRNFTIIFLISFSSSLIGKSTLEPLKPFNWQEVLEAPAIDPEGNQVLHFKGKNKPYHQDITAVRFVETHLKKATPLESDADVLRFASDHINIKEGFIIEGGVGTGRTINHIAALNPKRKVYGFDSFEGLPHAWKRTDQVFPAGTFRFKKNNPPFSLPTLNNVVLYKGMFKDTLAAFKDEIMKDRPVAFLHIDCDIYESAKDIFDILGNNIVPGTVIVLDELYNYPDYEHHEWKALQEFLTHKDLTARYLAFNINHEQVALVIEAKP